jgi:hypothetical protein
MANVTNENIKILNIKNAFFQLQDVKIREAAETKRYTSVPESVIFG